MQPTTPNSSHPIPNFSPFRIESVTTIGLHMRDNFTISTFSLNIDNFFLSVTNSLDVVVFKFSVYNLYETKKKGGSCRIVPTTY